jgi:hypothetical protein
MGFLDALLGKSRLPKPKPDKLFAISIASVTLNTNLNLKSEGAGICFKPIEASRFQNTELEIEELLAQRFKETSTQYKLKKDSYGYLWVILNDPDFEDLVSTLYMVSETLAENDFGEQLLCAVFKFKDESEVCATRRYIMNCQVLPLPFGVILLWYAPMVTLGCKAHRTIWRNLKV